MATEAQIETIMNKIVDSLFDAIERHADMPRELLLAALIRATAVYAKELAIPLDNLKKAIETASNTGE